MTKLQICGWGFIPLGFVLALIGFLHQETVGGMKNSSEVQAAAGAFIACIGAAGILMTVDSHRRGVYVEDEGETERRSNPTRFFIKVGGNYIFWAVFVIAGSYGVLGVWIKSK
jgi:hypothetical protein